MFFFYRAGRSVVRLARLLWEQEVAGSNPAAPTRKFEVGLSSRGTNLQILDAPVAQLDRATAF